MFYYKDNYNINDPAFIKYCKLIKGYFVSDFTNSQWIKSFK